MKLIKIQYGCRWDHVRKLNAFEERHLAWILLLKDETKYWASHFSCFFGIMLGRNLEYLRNLRSSNRWFILCTMFPADSKETGLGSSNQEAFPSAGKNAGVVIVSCSRMEVWPHSYFWWFGYFWGSWVSFVTADEFFMRVIKITPKIVVSWTHSLPFYF